MLSRAALNASFWKSALSKKYQLNIVQKCFQASAVTSAQKTEVETEKISDSVLQSWEKNPVDDLLRPYPSVANVVKESYPTIGELKQNDESVEEMLRVQFGRDMPTINDDKNPERDLVNFPTTVRAIDPPKTRLALVPEEYFQFFHKKLGVTGPYTFGFGFLTFLLSKEILIIEHEMVIGASLFAWIVIILKNFGGAISKDAEDKLIQENEGWLHYQNGTIEKLEDYIESNKHNQEAIKNQSILFNAKRENVHLQRESEYRNRLMKVYEHTKKKLDYQIATQDAQKVFAQKHMVEWVINSVLKSISADQEKLALTNSIAELKNLSSRSAGAI